MRIGLQQRSQRVQGALEPMFLRIAVIAMMVIFLGQHPDVGIGFPEDVGGLKILAVLRSKHFKLTTNYFWRNFASMLKQY